MIKFRSICKYLKSKLNYIFGASVYAIESIKNRYPCQVIDIKQQNKISNSIIRYCVLGKKENAHNIPVRELLDDKKLLEKFHPSDALLIGFICFGDIILSEKEAEREKKYNFMIKKLLSN